MDITDALLDMVHKRIAQLENENEQLRLENAQLRVNPSYDTLTRTALEIEYRKLDDRKVYVVMIDINYLHVLNEHYGSQEPVNQLIRKSFGFRDEDLLIKANYASGDEIAFIVKGNPERFMERLTKSMGENGISATMAYCLIEDDDLLGACECAIQKVYALKKQRGIEIR